VRVARCLLARLRAVAPARQGAADDGSAVVEFLGVALLLLVPTVYLVLVLARLQSAAFAVDGAAREAVRTYVSAADEATAAQQAATSVAIAFDDQGLSPDLAAEALTVSCSAARCLSADGTVTALVQVSVALPGVPGWLQDVVPLAVPVSAQATGVVDTFVGRG
jgi:hypothetical protein